MSSIFTNSNSKYKSKQLSRKARHQNETSTQDGKPDNVTSSAVCLDDRKSNGNAKRRIKTKMLVGAVHFSQPKVAVVSSPIQTTNSKGETKEDSTTAPSLAPKQHTSWSAMDALAEYGSDSD